MKKTKQAIALMLSFSLCLSMVACGDADTTQTVSENYLNEKGFPIVNEPITLTVFAPQTDSQPAFEDMYLM